MASLFEARAMGSATNGVINHTQLKGGSTPIQSKFHPTPRHEGTEGDAIRGMAEGQRHAPVGKISSTHDTRGWVGPRAGLDG